MSYQFRTDDTTIRVAAHLRTNPQQNPGTRDPILDLLVILDIVGSETVAAKMLETLSELYIEKPFSEFLAAAEYASPLELSK
jgi:hypothetical protein